MVSRLSLIFWRWVVVAHDRLHDARDKAMEADFDENVTYTSPAVHYLGVNRREDD